MLAKFFFVLLWMRDKVEVNKFPHHETGQHGATIAKQANSIKHFVTVYSKGIMPSKLWTSSRNMFSLLLSLI